MSRVLKLLLGLLCLLGIAFLIFLGQVGSGTRQDPSALETVVARRLRSFLTPSQARKQSNPLRSSPELLQEAAHHFADHCASCHGNDGSGNTSMGRKLYPRAPDMRMPATQQLSDGELYFIIHNGVRLTGMPAWGESEPDEDSWKLVLFIRHLPSITADELRDMQRFNPRSPAEMEEEKSEQDFLNGGPTPAEHEHH
jgi:mono/diheme cytochrome c family protein